MSRLLSRRRRRRRRQRGGARVGLDKLVHADVQLVAAAGGGGATGGGAAAAAAAAAHSQLAAVVDVHLQVGASLLAPDKSSSSSIK